MFNKLETYFKEMLSRKCFSIPKTLWYKILSSEKNIKCEFLNIGTEFSQLDGTRGYGKRYIETLGNGEQKISTIWFESMFFNFILYYFVI